MPWEVNYNKSQKIIEVILTSLKTAHDLQEVTSAAISLAKKHNTNMYLVDAEGLEYSGPLTAIYDLPDKQYPNEKLVRSSRIVILRPHSIKSQNDAQFYETVCLNRGWQVHVAATRKECIDWLFTQHK